jgi:hypothetical protein
MIPGHGQERERSVSKRERERTRTRGMDEPAFLFENVICLLDLS